MGIGPRGRSRRRDPPPRARRAPSGAPEGPRRRRLAAGPARDHGTAPARCERNAGEHGFPSLGHGGPTRLGSRVGRNLHGAAGLLGVGAPGITGVVLAAPAPRRARWARPRARPRRRVPRPPRPRRPGTPAPSAAAPWAASARRSPGWRRARGRGGGGGGRGRLRRGGGGRRLRSGGRAARRGEAGGGHLLGPRPGDGVDPGVPGEGASPSPARSSLTLARMASA